MVNIRLRSCETYVAMVPCAAAALLLHTTGGGVPNVCDWAAALGGGKFDLPVLMPGSRSVGHSAAKGGRCLAREGCDRAGGHVYDGAAALTSEIAQPPTDLCQDYCRGGKRRVT